MVSFQVTREFLECLVSKSTNESTQGNFFEWKASLQQRVFGIEIPKFVVCIKKNVEDDATKCHFFFDEEHPFFIENEVEIHRERVKLFNDFVDESLNASSENFHVEFFLEMTCGYTDSEVFLNDWLFIFNDTCEEEEKGGDTPGTTTTTTSSPETPTSTSSTSQDQCIFIECLTDEDCGNKNEFCNLQMCVCELSSSVGENQEPKEKQLLETSFLVVSSSTLFTVCMCFCCFLFSHAQKKKKDFVQFENYMKEQSIILSDSIFRAYLDVDKAYFAQREIIRKENRLLKDYPRKFVRNLFNEINVGGTLFIESNGNYGRMSSFLKKGKQSKREFSLEQRLHFCFCLVSCAKILRERNVNILHSSLTPSSFFLFKCHDDSKFPFYIKLFGTAIFGSLSNDLVNPKIHEEDRFYYYPPEMNCKEENKNRYNRQSENWVVGMSTWALFNMETPLKKLIYDKESYHNVIGSGERPDFTWFPVDKECLTSMMHLTPMERKTVESIFIDFKFASVGE